MTWIVPEAWRVPSPNKNAGRADVVVDTIVLHYTAGLGNARKVALLFADQLAGDVDNSAHLCLGRGGSIAQCVSLEDTAWHGGDGGKSRLPSTEQLTSRVVRTVPIGETKPMPRVVNRRSIGIEICNRGWASGVKAENRIEARHRNPASKNSRWERYYDPQIQALQRLLPVLVKACPGLRWVTAHEDVTHRDTLGKTGGKLDVGPAFPWRELTWEIYGIERVLYDFKAHAWRVEDGPCAPISSELVQAGLANQSMIVDPGPPLKENQ